MSQRNNGWQVSVGQEIRAMREFRQISIGQLAEAMTCSVAEIEQYESGRKRPSSGRLWDFAHHLNVPLSRFFAKLARQETPEWGLKTTAPMSGSVQR